MSKQSARSSRDSAIRKSQICFFEVIHTIRSPPEALEIAAIVVDKYVSVVSFPLPVYRTWLHFFREKKAHSSFFFFVPLFCLVFLDKPLSFSLLSNISAYLYLSLFFWFLS
jgi:hypothetical protein